MQVSSVAGFAEAVGLNKPVVTTLLVGLSSTPDLLTLQQQLAQLPIRYARLLFLLNSHEPRLQEQLLALGASHCLSKPVPHSKLLAALTLSHATTPNSPTAVTSRSKLPLNVLAVDDNPANLKLITAVLGDLVVEVHSCQNGRQAVELAQRLEFDLIFMDIQMPILDGISAAQTIRREGCNQQTPSSPSPPMPSPEKRERLMAQGMDEYLAKPIDEAQLERLLRHFTQESPAMARLLRPRRPRSQHGHPSHEPINSPAGSRAGPASGGRQT